MYNRVGILIAVTLVVLTSAGVFAQNGGVGGRDSNPLRGYTPADNSQPLGAQQAAHQQPVTHLQAIPSQTAASRENTHKDPEPPPHVIAAMYNENPQAATRQNARQISPSTPTIVDSNVAPAVHLPEMKQDLAPIARMLDSLEPQADGRDARDLRQPDRDSLTMELESEASDQAATKSIIGQKFDRSKFQTLIKHLAINTCIVLCFGLGIIVVAKKYFKGSAPRAKKATETNTIEIKSTLKLSPKSSLHLVEANDQRVIVAIDQTGIKSMIRLTESFASTLDSIEDLASTGLSDSGNPSDATNHEPESNIAAGTYSLGAIGEGHRSNPVPENPTPRPAVTSTRKDNEDAIRRKMEAALREHGLKDLILDTLKKG